MILLVPEALSLLEFYFLIILSAFTSMLTAAVGLGGGTLMLAAIAQFMPAKAIIPVHGLVQLGSNLGRAALMFQFIDKTLFGWFVIGGLLGVILGGKVAISLPADILRLLLGLFILYSTFGPRLSGLLSNHKALILGGFISSFLTMFVGATGPFVAAMLKPFGLKPVSQVATMSACLVLQHSLKVIIFGLLGFVYTEYLGLIALMVFAGFLGTLLGRNILIKVDEKTFKTGLTVVLSIMAVRLIWSSLRNLIN